MHDGGSSRLSKAEWDAKERARRFLEKVNREYEREQDAEVEHGDADSRVGDLAGDPYTHIGDRLTRLEENCAVFSKDANRSVEPQDRERAST